MEEQPNGGQAVAVAVLDDEPEPDALAVAGGSSVSDAMDKGDPAPEIPLATRLKEIVLTMLPIGVYGVGAWVVG